MGRLNTITDLAAQSSIISGATYGPAGELLTMTGSVTETRTYNSMKQLTGLNSSAWLTTLNLSYNYPATGNNGKIASQTDHVSGEQVVYAYDAMNRLASAAATNNSWGQSYAYDGFGNLTDQTVTAGTAPAYHVTYNPANNRVSGDSADANGNIVNPINYNYNWYTPYYDVENRLATLGYQVVQYSYAAGNKRVWRGVWTLNQQTLQNTLTTDEVTFWGVAGQKLATYQLSVVGGVINNSNTTPQLIATQTATNFYFGGKLIKNAAGYVGADRLGSIGKFYPWGQEKPSATTNGTEKFTGYFRDAETGLDYADQRYHSPGTGRFMTPDRYVISRLTDPGSWNEYAYTRGDPINRIDPGGACDQSADTSTSLTVCGTPDPAMPYVFALGYTPDIEFDQNIENQMSSTIAEVGASLQLAFAPFATSVTQVTQAKNSLNDELNNLGQNCQKILPAMSTLKSDASDLSFWDARLFGSMPIGFLPGAVASLSYQTVGSAVANSNAAILAGPNGTISTYVVLGTGFFNQNAATQGITLLHELLHYALQLSDLQIVNTYGISMQVGDTPSSAFQQWLQNDCQNKSN